MPRRMTAPRLLLSAGMTLMLLACSKSEPSGGDEPPGGGIYLDRPSAPVDPASITELPVEVNREFTCNMANVGKAMKVADVEGAPGEEVWIKPAGGSCLFHLIYREGSQEHALSSQASGYLLVVAKRFDDGVRLVCASEVNHRAGSTKVLRKVDTVPVRCWASTGLAFTSSVEAVPPDTEWAAWVRELKPHPTLPQAYVLQWAHDSTFQFFNQSDNGRPTTDGLFETVLAWSGTSLTAEPATQVSPLLNSYRGAASESWVPTAEEIDEFRSVIPFPEESP